MTRSSPCTLLNFFLCQLMTVPEEITSYSNALSLELATETAQLFEESGDGVTDNAAVAIVDIVGQVKPTVHGVDWFRYTLSSPWSRKQCTLESKYRSAGKVHQLSVSFLYRYPGSILERTAHDVCSCLSDRSISHMIRIQGVFN